MAADRDASALAPRWRNPSLPGLPSEDVVVSAPMSYSGSARRIMRLRRLARNEREYAALTGAAAVLVALAWTIVTVWYLMWGFLLVPYRLIRRGSRKRTVETLRHRELLETIAGTQPAPAAPTVDRSGERVADADRERTVDVLREHMLVGRLTADELEERTGAVHVARTRGDLAAIVADLPVDEPRPGSGRSAGWRMPR